MSHVSAKEFCSYHNNLTAWQIPAATSPAHSPTMMTEMISDFIGEENDEVSGNVNQILVREELLKKRVPHLFCHVLNNLKNTHTSIPLPPFPIKTLRDNLHPERSFAERNEFIDYKLSSLFYNHNYVCFVGTLKAIHSP